MDLEKLRASASYKGFFNIARLTKLVKTYSYHAESETPSLGDMLNLMAVDIDSLFWTLGCEWNRNSKSTNDVVELKYNVCNFQFHEKKKEIISILDFTRIKTSIPYEFCFFRINFRITRIFGQIIFQFHEFFQVCNADIIHVWNGNPNLDKIRNETNNKGHSRKLVQKTPEELEPQV